MGSPMGIIIIIIMNFNRRNSHANHGSKRRELVQHAHSRGSHAFIHTLYINTNNKENNNVLTQNYTFR